MLVIVAYDINTSSKAGQKRINHISKLCSKYGQRVQDSLFEMYIDWDIFKIMKMELEDNIEINEDSIRIYIIGNNYQNKVFYLGKDNSINIDDGVVIF